MPVNLNVSDVNKNAINITLQQNSGNVNVQKIEYQQTTSARKLVWTRPASMWTVRTAPMSNLRSICYGNGLFVAVGNSGVITSPNGINWTTQSSAPANSWSSVCFGNGTFVAVSNNYTAAANKVITSTDGITWTSRTAASGACWVGVCHGNNTFAAIANNPGSGETENVRHIMTSTNGTTWIERSVVQYAFGAIAYGSGLFVALISDTSNTRYLTSPDGATWTLRNVTAGNWASICHGNGTFVAVGKSEINKIMISTNGTTWTLPTTIPATDNTWASTCFGGGTFVAIGSNMGSISVGENSNRIMTSSNGTTWAQQTSVSSRNWDSICYGNGMFVAVNSGSSDNIMTSPG